MDAKHALGEPRVLISRSALLHNARIVRQALTPGTSLCAMIKADAYGHGAAAVAQTLCPSDPSAESDLNDHPVRQTSRSNRSPVDALAVASIDEAAALPGSALPILIFRPLENAFIGRQRRKLEAAIRQGWVLTLCSPAAADDVARVALACGRRASVQVMLDTGMTRSGVCVEKLDELLQRIDSHASLRLSGLCTHFANADDPASEFTLEQTDRFRRATAARAALPGPKLICHAANSGALFHCPASHLDMVRPGISLYGIDPTGRPCQDRPLRPVLKWTAPLVHVRDVKQGTGVGYGQTWHSPRDTRIGLVPVGYADGYPRCFSNRAVVLVQGLPAPVVGRVSMDLTTIDLTDVPQANVGDEVTLLDDDPHSPASVYELARWSDTIPYEVFCRVGQRIHRVPIADDVAPRPQNAVPANEVA